MERRKSKDRKWNIIIKGLEVSKEKRSSSGNFEENRVKSGGIKDKKNRKWNGRRKGNDGSQIGKGRTKESGNEKKEKYKGEKKNYAMRDWIWEKKEINVCKSWWK